MTFAPKKDVPQTQLNIRIDPALRDRLTALSKARYTSNSALVREGILLLLETDPKGIPPEPIPS
jgi:predicted DNA-binding protein